MENKTNDKSEQNIKLSSLPPSIEGLKIMGKKVKTIEIVSKEHYGDNCLVDSVNPDQGGGDRRPKGTVEIYEVGDDGKKKLVRKSNLVLYRGREMLAQRLVDVDNSTGSYSYTRPTKDEFVSWLGLGDGGVTPADPFDPIPPTLTDEDLSARVMINASDSSCADYHVVSVGYPDAGYYKHPFDSVTFERDILNDSKWLVVKITTTIGTDDANGSQISEAGLYSAASRSGGYGGNFSLFARVTFPSMVKTSDRRLIFVWYLYL